jgi:hypothetical protein
MASMPSNADPLTCLPSCDPLANRIHYSDDFMAGNSRVLNAWILPLLGQRIAVADPTGLYFDSYRSRTWFRDFTFHNFKGSIRS